MSLQERIVLELKEANIITLFKIIFKNKSVKYRAIGNILESIIRDHEIMVDILSKYIIYNKPFSAWVLKSNIMPNKLYIFFEEIPKWGMQVHQQMKSTWCSRKQLTSKNNTQVEIL